MSCRLQVILDPDRTVDICETAGRRVDDRFKIARRQIHTNRTSANNEAFKEIRAL